MKVRITLITPFYKNTLAAYFSNGRMAVFAKKDLDYKFWQQLEKMETYIEAERMGAKVG